MPTPKVERVSFKGMLLGNMDEIGQKIAKIPLYDTSMRNGELVVTRVESRNIHKAPFLFHIITFKRDGISVIYSIPQDSSERMRRAAVIKNIASIISLVADKFQIDQAEFLQYVDSVMDQLLGGISETYSSLFNKYDALLSEYRELKRLNLELVAANRNLTIQTAELTAENKSMAEQIKQLQTYSDQALMAMVEDWVEVHNSTIDIDEFAKTYKIAQPRVEGILDKMVSLGYLELKG